MCVSCASESESESKLNETASKYIKIEFHFWGNIKKESEENIKNQFRSIELKRKSSNFVTSKHVDCLEEEEE